MKYLLILFLCTPITILCQSTEIVKISNALEVSNPDSAGIGIEVLANGKNAKGVKVTMANNETSQVSSAFEGIINYSSTASSPTGLFLDIAGRNPKGIYVETSNNSIGNATGATIISNASQNVATGISVSANGGFNNASRGGTFEVYGRSGVAVEGIATTTVGVGGSFTANNKGGYFTSAGDGGYGVHGIALNETTQKISFGGYFEAKGGAGRGVVGIASNQTTQEITYGGLFQSFSPKGRAVYGASDGASGSFEHFGSYFEASGTNGVGTYSEGTKLAVHAKGNVLIEGKINDAILSMQSINGAENRVIVLQDDNEDLFFGDIDGENRDVIFRSGGSDLMHLKNNQRVGISVSNPSDFVHIDYPLNADGNFKVQNSGNTKLRVYNNGSVTVGYNAGDGGASRALQLQNSALYLEGNVRATEYNTYSDARIKSEGRQIKYGLKEVLALKPKSYNHHSSVYDEKRGLVKLKGPDYKRTIGFYAQEVQKVIPEAVHAPKRGYEDIWSMDYTKLIPVLTRAIQEQQMLIEDLASKLENESKKTIALEARLLKMEKKLENSIK